MSTATTPAGTTLKQPRPAEDVDPSHHPRNKPCTLCGIPRPVLVRCQIDEEGRWHFVCPGRCWNSVSGGVEDARGKEAEYPFYRYGGMWKNKHAMVSAKKPKLKGKRGGAGDKSGAANRETERIQTDGEHGDETGVTHEPEEEGTDEASDGGLEGATPDES